MEFSNPYWGEATKIQVLQRWILIHSFLYYEMDHTFVEDHVYDRNAEQLKVMMETNPDKAKRSRYAYAFEGYDASTGFDVLSKLNKEHLDLVRRDAWNLKDHKMVQNYRRWYK